MAHTPTTIQRNILGNLRLSAIVCAIVTAVLAVYAVVTGTAMMWDVVLFLALGMLISSLVNAWMDARRNRHSNR